jgi:hypothetical protein
LEQAQHLPVAILAHRRHGGNQHLLDATDAHRVVRRHAAPVGLIRQQTAIAEVDRAQRHRRDIVEMTKADRLWHPGRSARPFDAAGAGIAARLQGCGQ